MQFVPRNPGDLHTVLNRLPDEMLVEAGVDTGVSATTVGELRRLLTWPKNLVVIVPAEPNHRESTVKISRGRLQPLPKT
jgi:hypothetical protein